MLGGPSAEREVSLRSGHAVAAALRSCGHQVWELDPVDATWTLPASTQVVFLALHGTYGEDGTIQQQLETLGMPFTGCDAESSRVAFDKLLTKKRCVQSGIPTPRYQVIDSPSAPWPDGWRPPVVLKPVRQGSSVGLQFVRNESEWSAALTDAFRFDTEVLLEEFISGRELTVGILDGQILPIVEVRPKKGAYDYRNKYTAGATDYFCPAPLPVTVAAQVGEVAQRAFQAVGGRDYARMDLMLNADNRPFLLEVNTLPGMTATSLLPKAAAAAGIAYTALCHQMVEIAWRRAGKTECETNSSCG
jgi:D-alanine-D-alanine ligase